jgi:hypothetical protein
MKESKWRGPEKPMFQDRVKTEKNLRTIQAPGVRAKAFSPQEPYILS